MEERWKTLLKRAAATTWGLGSLIVAFPFTLPPGLEPSGLGGILGLIESALPWILGATLAGAVALSQALVWSKGDRGGHDLGVAVAFLALLVGALLGPVEIEAAIEAGGLVGAAVVVAMPLGAAGLLRFAAVFPRPVRIEEINRAVDLGRGGEVRFLRRIAGRPAVPERQSKGSAGVRGFLWLMRNAWPVELVAAGVAVTMMLASGGVAEFALLLAMAMGEIPALLAVAVIGGLHRELTDPADRRRMQWIGLGFGWGLLTLALLPLGMGTLAALDIGTDAFQAWIGTPAPWALGLLLGPIFVLGGIAMAMFKDGLFDPRLALRRTTIYGGATVILLLIFTVAEELLSGVIAPALGLGDGVAGIIAGLSAAALFTPIRNAIRRWAERNKEEPALAAPQSLFSDRTGSTPDARRAGTWR